jgi:hypothetical protein
VWNVGCKSKPSTPVGKIKGTITIDGGPIPTGEIHFVAPGVPPQVLEIKNGAFEGQAPVGDNKVEVFIYVEGPPVEKYGGARSKTNTVPDRYWGANTTLAANVTAGGPNEFKFEVYSK